jgi:hypothetical protein
LERLNYLPRCSFNDEMGSWYEILKEQLEKCKATDTFYTVVEAEHKIGLSDNVLTNAEPINGLRHPASGDMTGWYLWAGEDFSEAEDFFKPYCVRHLLEMKPEVLKYLGLPPGYRFLLDRRGYEDVWYDENLLDV